MRPSSLCASTSLGEVFKQPARRRFCLSRSARAEVKIGQRVIQICRAGIGVERVLVLLHGVCHIFGPARLHGLLLVDIGQRCVVVGLRPVRILARQNPGLCSELHSAAKLLQDRQEPSPGCHWGGCALGASLKSRQQNE